MTQKAKSNRVNNYHCFEGVGYVAQRVRWAEIGGSLLTTLTGDCSKSPLNAR